MPRSSDKADAIDVAGLDALGRQKCALKNTKKVHLKTKIMQGKNL